MNTIEAIILGTVQGLTEFLPVSSSGHLVLFQNLFGLKEPELLFDICLHVGTLLAVIIVFYREILEILTALIQLPRRMRSAGGLLRLFQVDPDIRMALLIVIGSVPTAIIGLLFKKITDQLFGSTAIVGCMLIVTGTLLWMTRRIRTQGRPVARTTLKDACLIGIVQGLAILPGISRSGSTIATALFLGVERKLAGRYSFLLSIPAIVGALVLGLDAPELATRIPLATIIAGSLVSAAVGWLALVILLRVVDRGQLHRFAPYCWLVGLVTLAIALTG
ncbi:undecaprenyl-diphosphatase [Desulfosarcina ovata subsp. sediminis]|uniref:Undecaprenyl-diphosphatase n=1 Tax=Desulfosarcina ovata subsp. sediminis TaxID=885957 RepID=A0A5K7ZX64_9BACT|nr:undecaprenyl-diphosphate phosphatase [Desulfosarcina ovata]BBO84842.1 undecaprenyl-diphosphatase [Desulfosarcina ovata subsp. sediminis]